MTSVELLFFIAVLAIGALLYRRARVYGQTRIASLEREAYLRIDRYLDNLAGDPSEFQVFTRRAGSESNWEPVDLRVMRLQIITDCTASGPDAFDYQKARFSVTSDLEEKRIYYVVGTNTYKFQLNGGQL